MRIWHQSFTVLDDVPHYRDALARHLASQVADGTTVDLHGMAEGTYPSAYPGTHIGYAYLSGLHREQFVQAALHAQDDGYDAFLIATIPDTGYEEVRTLIDIPVVTLGHTSVLMAAQLGDCVGIVNFIEALVPQLRRNLRNYRLEGLVGPIVQVAAGFTDVMAAYADPQPLLAAFTAAARQAVAQGATVIVPGEGPMNVFLADQGLVDVDGVPVLDSLGTCAKVAELRAAQHRSSGIRPTRVGFYGAQPPRELLDAARSFYGVPAALR
jgi:Asp/Glu/hydantoin racemase